MLVYEASLSYKLLRLGDPKPLSTCEDIVAYLASAVAENPVQESVFVIPMDRRNRPLFWQRLTTGSQTAAMLPMPVLFRTLILSSCSAFAICHNHPSGSCEPSSADHVVTRRVKEAALLMEIEFIDHVIIGHKAADPSGLGHYSFRNHGSI
jgi:DNA repair protein RadC